MASRVKEDEKNERAIRSLLKQASNRRCINCNSLGPQYVCLTFWTFVCTQCSGIHREFTHRIKSVSMSKFTSQEVASLESGGNERAREMYFKNWDPVRRPLPDSSHVDRLRDFIRMVYVEKRLCAEKVQARGGERDDGLDKRLSASQPSQKGFSRSPPNEERNRNDQVKHRTDVMNRNRNEYYHEEKRFSNESNGRRHDGRFQSERERWKYGGSPPPICSVKEILGEDVPPLRIESDESQSNGAHEKDKTHSTTQDGHVQRVGSSSSFCSGDDTSSVPPIVKREEPISLIDFSETEPEPSTIKEHPDAASNNTGWASFDIIPSSTVPALASLVSTLTPAPATTQTPSSTEDWSSLGHPSNLNWSTLHADSSAANTVATGGIQTARDLTREMSSNTNSTVIETHSMPMQPWNAFPTDSSAANSVSVDQLQLAQGMPSQAPSVISFSATADNISMNATSEKSTRSELPEDFFSGGPQTNLQFSEFPVRPHYIQTAGMDLVGGSYNHPQPSKSINPFDFPGDNSSIGSAATEFPNMTSIQEALPNPNMDGQWTPANLVAPGQLYAPTTVVPAANGNFINQQIPNSTFPTMLPGTIPGSLPSALMQNPQLSTFPNATLNFFIEGKVPSHAVQGGILPSALVQNPEPSVFTNANVSSFGGGSPFSAVQGASFQSQSGLPSGPVSRIPGTDSMVPFHGAQQSAFGTFGNVTISNTSLPAQFLPQGSLGPVGNPFG